MNTSGISGLATLGLAGDFLGLAFRAFLAVFGFTLAFVFTLSLGAGAPFLEGASLEEESVPLDPLSTAPEDGLLSPAGGWGAALGAR